MSEMYRVTVHYTHHMGTRDRAKIREFVLLAEDQVSARDRGRKAVRSIREGQFTVTHVMAYRVPLGITEVTDHA